MNVAVLIGIVIAIVVGVSLIPTIIGTAQQVEETAVAAGEPLSSSASSLLGILPIIFVAVLILGAISWLGFAGNRKEGESFFRLPKLSFAFLRRKENGVAKNPRELVLRIEEASKRWIEYHNNLDSLVGVETVNQPDDNNETFGLTLAAGNKLGIDKHYDWYITDKHPEHDMFKVVGLHKKDASKNLVYLLGKNSQTQRPYLVSLPIAVESSLDGGLNYAVSEESKRLMGIGQSERELGRVGVRSPKTEKITVRTLGYPDEEIWG